MKAVRPVVLAAFFGLSWSIAELARAEAPEHASASLVYSAPIACPSSSELSRAVAERLGYEPFREGAEKTISVKIDATKSRRFRGRIEVRKGAASAGERDLPEEPDCAELVRAAALLVALQIDPLAGARTPPPPATTSAAEVAPPPSSAAAPTTPVAPPPAPTPSAQSVPIRLEIALGAAVSALRLPTAGMGAFASLGIAKPTWSLALEAHADFPLSSLADPGSGGSVTASLVTVAVPACARGSFYFGCALLEGGALQGTGGDVKVPKRDTTPLFAAGLRGGLHHLTEGLFLFRLHVDVLAPLTRTTLSLNGLPVWTTPTVGLALGAGVGKQF